VTIVQPFSAPADQGRDIWHMGALMRFKAVGEDTGGQFWLAEQVSNRGYASPLHRHTNEDELFIVLDGELSIGVDDRTYQAAAGSITFAPRGLAHTFQVESPEARFLILSTPAGFERWFFETGMPAQELTVPPAMELPPDIEGLIRSLKAYDVELVGPPPMPPGARG